MSASPSANGDSTALCRARSVDRACDRFEAAWDEGVVDYVQLYVTPKALGAAGVPLFNGRPWSMSSLLEPKIELLGPDTLIEGYVHRPH